MGCNFSLPRTAFEAVNGYEEDWPGMPYWEDWDLEVRLRKAGRTFRPILNAAVVFHLHHSERPLDEVRYLRETRHTAKIRSQVGLDQYKR